MSHEISAIPFMAMEANDRIVTMPSLVGGSLWLDLDRRFLYEVPPFTPFGDVDPICRTLTMSLERRKRHLPPYCPGQMASSTPGEDPRPHNHLDGVPEGFLRYSVRDHALLNFYALLGRRTTLSQFYHIADYYSELLYEPGVAHNVARLNPDRYFKAADRRTPYKVEEDDSPASEPVMYYRAGSVAVAVELNVPFIKNEFGRVMETFLPVVDLGYTDELTMELPNSREPYVTRFPPSGMRFSSNVFVFLFS